uniref:L-seryl-tRNA(Sec) kinase n=1 Tax=Eutreptiella gymnastica TaxID=73025 RepID=A0A7S1N9W8_9EUGL|mmetsp:Transcript_143245/g.250016  ORF Transcript_143245/g.250016 Transcript_143245/m.250016 type:complete len:444 (+) Transcript_143245:68-1399(+)
MVVCLGLLCGVPGTGKSTIAKHLTKCSLAKQIDGYDVDSKGLHVTVPARAVVYISFDTIFDRLRQAVDPNGGEFSTHMWQHARVVFRFVVGCLMAVLTGISDLDSQLRSFNGDVHSMEVAKAFLDEYLACVGWPHSLTCANGTGDISEPDATKSSEPGVVHAMASDSTTARFPAVADGAIVLLLVEDNFYYWSMRYSFFQLARQYGAAFAQVFLVASPEVCVQRNSLRSASASIPQHVIVQMYPNMELPLGPSLLSPSPEKTCASQSWVTAGGLGDIRLADGPVTYSKHAGSWQRNHMIIDTEKFTVEQACANIRCLIAVSTAHPVGLGEVRENNSGLDPMTPLPAASTSSLQQALDLALRRTAGQFISLLPAELKGGDTGRRLAALRKDVMAEVKREGVLAWLAVHANLEQMGEAQQVSHDEILQHASSVFRCMCHQMLMQI